MSAQALRLRGREIVVDRPLLMGILNATPDSFSDGGEHATLDARVERAAELLAQGADIIDVGGESNVTNRPAVDPGEEIERVVELIARVTAELGAIVSVDTYKAPVAEAAVAAGAHMVNDISGLGDPRLADTCAATGAALVIMHTPVAPKTQSHDESRYSDIAAEIADFLTERAELARSHGVDSEQIVFDPGPDFGKTPAQTVAALQALPALRALGRPLLLALSRKDFIGAINARRPRERLAGTLAALAYTADLGPAIFRVHDVRAAADFLAVRAALRGDAAVDPALRVPEHARREPPAA